MVVNLRKDYVNHRQDPRGPEWRMEDTTSTAPTYNDAAPLWHHERQHGHVTIELAGAVQRQNRRSAAKRDKCPYGYCEGHAHGSKYYDCICCYGD